MKLIPSINSNTSNIKKLFSSSDNEKIFYLNVYRGTPEEFEVSKPKMALALQKHVARSEKNLRYEIKIRGSLMYLCLIENMVVPELVEEAALTKEEIKELKEDVKKIKDKVKIDDDPEPTP